MPDGTWYWDKTEHKTVLYSSALVSALNGMEGSQYSKEGVRSNVIVEIRYSWVNESYCGLHPSVLSITVLFAHFRMRGRPLKLFLLGKQSGKYDTGQIASRLLYWSWLWHMSPTLRPTIHSFDSSYSRQSHGIIEYVSVGL